MAKGRILQVKQSEITIISQQNTDYISLTDMTVTFREGSGLISKWITNKNTIEYLGVWERINNPNFNEAVSKVKTASFFSPFFFAMSLSFSILATKIETYGKTRLGKKLVRIDL